MELYFDNSATTKPCAEAADAVMRSLTEHYGNPSSNHFRGIDASDELKSARKSVAAALGCSSDNLIFTGSGTLANNTAIMGVRESIGKLGNRIVTTAAEHPSVSEAVKKLELCGAQVIRIAPRKDGNIDADELMSAINRDTVLVCVMAVNNETGAVFPVNAARAAVRREKAPALIHCDCVQAFGKLDFTPASLGADTVSISSHKIHGPKGAGALYIKSGITAKPYILGGGQEKGVYSGTEAMPAIMGFAAAAEALPDKKAELLHITALRDLLLSRISECENIRVNSPADALPYILNISILGLPSQPAVNALSEQGICVSEGSACKRGHRSAVLSAMGLPGAVIDSAVRISFSRFNTEEEVNTLATALVTLADKFKGKR